MSYYDDLLVQIDKMIIDKDYEKAESIIKKELSMPYIPSNIEISLKEYLSTIPKNTNIISLSDENIIDYLKSDESKQLRAVEELNNKNLREYIKICNDYLKGDGFINAKVLLIDSLIKQDISDEFHMSNNGLEYDFIPRYIMSPESSIGFIKADEILKNKYMKEPSKYELAKQLLYKECLLALPMNYQEDEALELSNKVYSYIENAFK